jgi:alpha-glucoside transport system substrate-binding protein
MKRALAWGMVAAVLLVFVVRCTGAFDGQATDERSVRIFAPWMGNDADLFMASIEDFDAGRVQIRYTGSLDFTADLRDRAINGIDVPDVAVVPQPGLIQDLIDANRLVPFDQTVLDALAANYPPERWQTDDGPVYAFPYRDIVKSLVWYRPDVWAEHGWAVPTTIQELEQLATEIADSGGMAPWCFGLYSGADTGWPATDWVEDLLLRTAGPDVYDDWVAGTIGFSNVQVEAAFELFASLVLQQGRVAGGTRTMLQTRLPAIDDPLFADEPGCAMYKQASFATSWFPADATIAPDGDVYAFVLPGARADEPPPLLVSGDSMVQMAEGSDVDAFLAFAASPSGADVWASSGGYLSSRSSVDPDTYYDERSRPIADILLQDHVVRFDGSDQFSSADRSLFFDLITRWASNATSYSDLARLMDAARADRAL